MKPTTKVWVQLDSKGKPEFSKKLNGTIQEISRELILWLLTVHMGTHIEIRIARTEFELELGNNKRVADADMAADFAAMFNELTLEVEQSQENQ